MGFFGFFGLRSLVLDRCCGPALAMSRMNRSKRGHASGSSSIGLVFGAMANPFSSVIQNAEIYLDPGILDNKPEMALLVVKIFAVWASIERELNFLLVRVLGLGPDSRPRAALAMFDVLTAQHLQLRVLHAAAEAELSTAYQIGSLTASTENYDVFSAVLNSADSAQKPRNQLSHWVWADAVKDRTF
jgi:hypothetical protein